MELPIRHLSFSALRSFLSNPLVFRREYILNIWDRMENPAMMVGSAFHEALKRYYDGKPKGEAAQAGIDYINSVRIEKIDFGKTGSLENIVRDYTKTLNHYFAEEPKFGEIVSVEESITCEWEHEGSKGALPIKVKVDLLTREGGILVPIDHKKVSEFTDPDEESPAYILQSMFTFFALKSRYGEEPGRMVFNEVRTAANSDGSPQVRPYEIIFSEVPQYKTYFVGLFGAVVRQLSNPDCLFLPNFSDRMNGKRDWEYYTADIGSVEMPKPVHRTTQMPRYAEKRFVESASDSFENRDLPPEQRIKAKLMEFGVSVEPREIQKGGVLTRYTFAPARGVSMKKVTARVDDIKIAIGAKHLRVEAPIPGTKLIGVEVPNEKRERYDFGRFFTPKPNSLEIPLGIDIMGELRTGDLAKMPHLLIAGTTGSGKSVFIHSVIKALAAQNGFDGLEMLLIDPKRVELSAFKDLPHLVEGGIRTEYEEILKALRWVCGVMDWRYKKLEQTFSRNIDDYNASHSEKMKRVVVVIDEFADLMMRSVDRKMVEAMILKLAQLARAAGIHLVIATQRPTVDIITGNIKANMPTRIAFSLFSAIDSKTVLDDRGAEELTGMGDLLYLSNLEKGLLRLQGLNV